MKITVKEIAGLLQAKVEGDESLSLEGFAPIEEAVKGTLTFLSNPKYEQYLYSTQATAVLVNTDFKPEKPIDTTLIRVDDVYTALSVLLDMFNKHASGKRGIEQPSYIAAGAQVASDAYIGAFAYIGEGSTIGEGTQVYPQSYIGDNVRVGNNTIIYAGAKVYSNTVIGNNCIIHAGAVIGSDGFGFAPQDDGTYKKVPQTGNVIIKDNVEIGANTTIDRATIRSTLIEDGVKLDNLIQVAHNVEIGANTAIAAQTGISGSTKLGANCVIGGQVGIVGHITIADGSQIGAQSGISKAIAQKGKKWFGSPADELRQAMKIHAVYRKLPELYNKVQDLEKEIHGTKKR